MSYDVVSKTKICFHKDGGRPYGCSKDRMISVNCEKKCTNLDKCIAFSFRSTGICYLWVSSKQCPSDWSPTSYGRVATAASSLVEGTWVYHNCKVKKGRILLKSTEVN